ncbi:bifunctional lysylphosphatidylglycerol flippase/synthetase MprF [Hydrogenophaga pseudoflava]|uniref:bifunctional lysylphosphatidylglycerol flippase/synthetase MprF n=1 Tax=Hydrogenophaga pseudoflava TaxID=47421 RepID=UPI0027E4475E|nr:bifunctional lysylphosphatidylglycerol flippase/synthetase MprF [Hydrogenophaga pseudoflava]MDQ7746178.1 bifunctional lysylphosphatidylglycerol flippase/synthetase MprF [Hydrogenophaga pseudoflava]
MLSAPELLTARLTRWRFWLRLGVGLLLFALVAEAVLRVLSGFSYGAVMAAAKDTPAWDLLAAVAATALSFLALTFYDRSALQYAGARLPYRVVAQTSFIAYALSNTVGLGVFTGGAVRLRLYGAAGLEAGQISRAIAFNALGFTVGIAVVGAAALVWGAESVASLLRAPPELLRAAGVAALLVTAAALGACRRGGRWSFRGWTFRLPSASLAGQQLLISALDVVAAAAVLWVLLPAGAVGFPAFVGFYSLAIAVGVISHVPGGLGVFEAVLLLALGQQVPADRLVGALVLYRVIYHLLPLALALLLLVGSSWRRGVSTPLVRAASALAPLLLSAFTFVSGVVLLVSGATPATEDATAHLRQFMPLPAVEAAHFLASVIGLALLFVARGMLLRLDVAWWAGLVLALASLVLCLPKGIAVSEAVLLGLLALSLALSHRHFNRRAAVLSLAFSRGWLVAVLAVVLAVGVLLVFVYQDTDYVDRVWWRFEFDGHAPRSLRAMVAVALLTLCVALAHLLHRAPPALPRPDGALLARAQAVVMAQESAGAGLALMGDKSLMFSESGRAFLMFSRKGRSWVALYDPVGPREEWPELVWRFVELAGESGGRAAFYQVRPQALPVYLDAGLRVYKLGECATVELAGFSLEGKRRANLRHGVARAQRDGLGFEWLPAGAAESVFDALQAVSDDWLGRQDTAEKAFSLGAFSREYVMRQPLALVRHEGRIVAFATMLVTGLSAEAAVDLMRQRGDAPKTTMDFLFTQIILHLREQGVARFNLGMVPLSGMASHRLAPRWQRLGRLLFNHGENFYNFQGLRSFKEKFDPVWEPRYLAAPGGLSPLLVLSDTAALIAGGWRRVITK